MKKAQPKTSTDSEAIGTGLGPRMHQLLEENWCRCDEKYRKFKTDRRFRLRSPDKQTIAETLLTVEERDRLMFTFDSTGRYLTAANAAKVPFDFAMWYLKKKNRRLRAPLGPPLKLDDEPIDVLKGFQYVQDVCLRELVRRVTNPQRLQLLDTEELNKTLKVCRENLSEIQKLQGDGAGMAMKIITAVPMDEE